jgi:ketosteroid isomerase-like protein
MSERDPELQRLIDESAIRKLLALYPRALDRKDHKLLASLFHPDAIDDHGHYNGPASGFVDWIAAAKSDVHWMHNNGTQIIEVDGDVAQCETYCYALCREPTDATKEIFLRVRYLDRVEKRSGEWRIAHRRVVFSPCHVIQTVEQFPLTPECLTEGGFPTDQVYQW